MTSTVSSHLYTLLDAHSSGLLIVPFLHPYAPTAKGKERANPVALLEQSAATIHHARTLLERNDPARTRLVLALREISEHQTFTPKSHPSSLTSPLASLSPLELLRHLASKLSIQAYIEDSQFGLLKQSLALAGKSFVIDIDLETDPVEDESPGLSGVRLSKLTANHVNGDATGKSEWIARVLKDKIGAYLEAWNTKGEVTETIASLESEFVDLKELDGLTGANWFLELETVASEASSLTKPTIFPTISLCSELFRIRPGPLLDDVPGQWINTDWILEHVPKSTSFAEGVVVSRHWLSGVESAPRPWDGSVRVEQLLAQLEADRAGQPNTFAYASDYVHGNQHWAMAEPGPVGFVIGRVKVPRVREEWTRVFEALREQVVMNTLISRVFTPDAVPSGEGVPITMTLGDRKITMSLPVLDATLILTILPSTTRPFVKIESEIHGQIPALARVHEVIDEVNRCDSIDLVEVVRRLDV